MQIPTGIIRFLENQEFVMVSTLDPKGRIHNAVKGIAKVLENGEIYIIDLYKQQTFDNLKNNRIISVTAVDNHSFLGYCLKGEVKVIKEEIDQALIDSWQHKIIKRISARLIRNLKALVSRKHHPEAELPKPAYLIILQVEEIVDLTPGHLKMNKNKL